MADDQAPRQLPPDEDEGPVLPRRPVRDTAEMDITPMIDIVFLLLIFFLVCSTASLQSAVDLPPARYGSGVSEQNSAIIEVVEGSPGGSARVYLVTGGTRGKALDPGDEDSIADHVKAQGKPNVLIKAAKGVKCGDVHQVESAAARVGGMNLHEAVMEVD